MKLNIVKLPRQYVPCFEFLYKRATWFKEIPGNKGFFMNKSAARIDELVVNRWHWGVHRKVIIAKKGRKGDCFY